MRARTLALAAAAGYGAAVVALSPLSSAVQAIERLRGLPDELDAIAAGIEDLIESQIADLDKPKGCE